MKALCITGADNATLADIAAPFFEAGMKRSRPLQRESSIDFARWHQQVSDTLVNNKPMGKLWENIATDLILANLESDCWGWYEANSVNALEFWANLEPNIHFLLVCTRPEQELADKMAHTKPDSEAHGWLEQWHQRHQAMLDFYLKYPDRCILVDATDARRHLGGQLALAHEHWQLPLHAASVEDQPRDAHNEPRQDQPGSQLASLIVRELIKSSNKDITGLYVEMQAAQYHLNQDDTSEPASSRLMDWLRADIDSPMLQSLLTDFHALHSAASQSQRLLALQSDQANTARQLEQDLNSAKSEQQTANQQMQDARQENELLLLQLHQVQEELEHYFLEHQKNQLDTTELQQKLERYKRQGTAQYSTAQVTLMHDGQLQWQLTDAQLGGREWPAFTITGQAKLSKTELTIHSDDQAETWVLNTQSTSRALSNAQFAMAQDLPKVLKGALERAPLAARQKKRWHKALDRLQLRLNQQPPRLLYSNVRLKHEQVNPDYEHLWLTLEQPSFNNTHLQSWSFRLSCAGVTPNEFGNQPKLELPEQDTQLLDNWFQESHDQFGNKLEVRFALPNAMDMGVWKRLAASDQRLLKTLIDQLPDILAELEQQGRSLQRPWADWQQVVADMQCITRTKTVK
jgi:hypothetical protein